MAQGPAAREAILQSPRWRRLERTFNEWLSVQRIYSAEEVADLKAGLRRQVMSTPVDELDDFMFDTEERLNLLMSDEAMDARSYLSVFNDQARRERVASNGEVPNVFELSVSQLRQELRQFEQQRASRSAAQRNFNRVQSQQAAAVAREQRARRAQQEQAMRQARLRQANMQNWNLQQQRNRPIASPYTPRPLVTSEMVGTYEILRGLRGW